MHTFINRTREMGDLAESWDRGGAEIRLLYGRRRVGKTYLLQHFLSDNKPHCYFLASAMTIGGNLERLAQALIDAHPEGRNLTPADMPSLWSILQFYGGIARERRFALVLDEFQYLVEADPSIPSQNQIPLSRHSRGLRNKHTNSCQPHDSCLYVRETEVARGNWNALCPFGCRFGREVFVTRVSLAFSPL